MREEAKMVACCPEGKGKPIGEREIEIGERERGEGSCPGSCPAMLPNEAILNSMPK